MSDARDKTLEHLASDMLAQLASLRALVVNQGEVITRLAVLLQSTRKHCGRISTRASNAGKVQACRSPGRSHKAKTRRRTEHLHLSASERAESSFRALPTFAPDVRSRSPSHPEPRNSALRAARTTLSGGVLPPAATKQSEKLHTQEGAPSWNSLTLPRNSQSQGKTSECSSSAMTRDHKNLPTSARR